MLAGGGWCCMLAGAHAAAACPTPLCRPQMSRAAGRLLLYFVPPRIVPHSFQRCSSILPSCITPIGFPSHPTTPFCVVSCSLPSTPLPWPLSVSSAPCPQPRHQPGAPSFAGCRAPAGLAPACAHCTAWRFLFPAEPWNSHQCRCKIPGCGCGWPQARRRVKISAVSRPTARPPAPVLNAAGVGQRQQASCWVARRRGRGGLLAGNSHRHPVRNQPALHGGSLSVVS